MESTPPQEAIEAAIRAAREGRAQGACLKSSRGAAVFSRALGVFGVGHNGQPPPFQCRGDAACREACGKLCVHAEERAIMAALPLRMGRAVTLELVHVKVVGGELVAGGGPSCVTCSRTILDVGLDGVWLYEQPVWIDRPSQGFFPKVTEYPDGDPRWRRYTAEEFHHLTLYGLGLVEKEPPRG
jgi:deoxycytidylate deaminase